MSVRDDIARAKQISSRPGYKERAKAQCLAWAQGRSYHDQVNEECCPDFSCCFPDLFTKDEQERWAYYRKHYGADS